MLPSGVSRLMQLVVLYQGADVDAEHLALTEQLFDAALGELGMVTRGQPCLIVGDFNVEPNKIPCLAKGISAGLWVDLESALALACGGQLAVTCERTWGSTGGHRRDFMVGCTLAAAAVTSCAVVLDRWIVPHLAVRAHFECTRWTCRVTQPVQRAPLWPASWLPAVDRSRGCKSAEIQRAWEIYDDLLQYMARLDALSLHESLGAGDVSRAWLVWFSAAETALADVYRFACGLVLERSLIMGMGAARMRVVCPGGLEVRRARKNAADAHEGGDVLHVS